VEETASASEEMANQAQELLGLVEKFKTGDNLKGVEQVQKSRDLHLKTTALSAAKEGNGNGRGNGRGKKIADTSQLKAQNDESLKDFLQEEGFEEF
jgi:hypothetical protein